MIDLFVWAGLMTIFGTLGVIATMTGGGRHVRRNLWTFIGLPMVMASLGYWVPKLFIWYALR